MMRFLVAAIIVSSNILACTGENSLARSKRSVWQFSIMIQCARRMTNRFPTWSFWTYNNYGCYCGYGGTGRPVDDIDRCCFRHDQCYSNVMMNYDLSSWCVYLAFYKYSCNSHGTIKCDDPCPWKQDLCYCDQQAAYCFARHHQHYNRAYKNVHKRGRCYQGFGTRIS